MQPTNQDQRVNRTFKMATLHPDGSITLYRPDGSPALFDKYGQLVEEKAPQIITIDDSEEDTCIVCLNRRANTLFLPCGHSIVCKTCLTEIESTSNRDMCILCRTPITEKLY